VTYPNRLIEVDLPIKRISAQARREKDMRRGHVPLIHIYPATRPPAACRSIICAALWFDPVDPNCPTEFISTITPLLANWISKNIHLVSKETYNNIRLIQKDTSKLKDPKVLRNVLLDLIADFSDYDNSTKPEYLSIIRKITTIASKCNSGEEQPIVADTFSGGGAIPLEALRIGANAFASDLNPIAYLLNKLVLEYVPKFGDQLIKDVESYWFELNKILEKKLSQYYLSKSSKNPICFIWARTIRCEGPRCGVEVPLIRSQLLVKKSNKSVALEIKSKGIGKPPQYKLIYGSEALKYKHGTMTRNKVTCPACDFTHKSDSIKRQLIKKNGGASDSKMLVVVSVSAKERGRIYKIASDEDIKSYNAAKRKLSNDQAVQKLIPDEILPIMSGVFNAPIYGHSHWSDLFNDRQKMVLSNFVLEINNLKKTLIKKYPLEYSQALITTICLLFDKILDMNSALCVWQAHAEIPAHVFGRWALPMIWDYAETNPFSGSSGSAESTFKRTMDGINYLIRSNYPGGNVTQSSATKSNLPDDSVDAFITDPPYYNAIPYADISDFFYHWLKLILNDVFPDSFKDKESPKKEEICEMAGWDSVRYPEKDKIFFEKEMTKAFTEGRRVLKPNGIGVVVFAHKETASWEAIIKAIIDSGFAITSSWAIDTEMQSRLRGKNFAALSSSIHLTCRPKEDENGKQVESIGDWRDVLKELPNRIHDWMPRLAAEGIAGADAIFGCLGPALEIFSRYSSVEKPNGSKVELKEYLEQVWAAISNEAMSVVFKDADTKSFEPDARLSAMWLWTITAGKNGNGVIANEEEDEEEESLAEEGETSYSKKKSGYTLEYDTARKIAQGLGARLEDLQTLIEVKGDKARLRSVEERTQYLFGAGGIRKQAQKKKKKTQLAMFENADTGDDTAYHQPELKVEQAGKTVLDRLHQAMLLFSTGRIEALKRFLVEDGVGADDRFWKLAQAFTALYPKDTDERRWVEAVQTYKKSLGF
jgi:putative DNA methylase